MYAMVNKDTKQLDFPFDLIPVGTFVEVVGTETEEGTIAIRFKGKTAIVNAKDLTEVIMGVVEHDC